MTLTLDSPLDRTSARRALEALRNGVPNRDAVRALGSTQPRAVDAFEEMLAQLEAPGGPHTPRGLLLSAEFGVGKSHTLRLLEQIALQQGFVVSTVVVSKETPLHDSTRLFKAAIRNGRLPNSRGELLQDLTNRLSYKNGGPKVDDFVDWALRGQPHQIIAASVHLHERITDPDDTQALIDYWAGEKISLSDLRRMMKGVGNAKAFDVKQVRQAELAPVRFELVSRLVRAAGYKGWIILFDEAELIGRYSILQRTRAYAQMAKWTNAVANQGVDGVGAVFTISGDFALEVLDHRRDLEEVPKRLRAKGDEASLALLTLASEGMEVIKDGGIRLDTPTRASLGTALDRVRSIYESAYGQDPQPSANALDGDLRDMRAFVRRWVNEWDLKRLHPDASLDTEIEEISISYDEDKDLQTETPDED